MGPTAPLHPSENRGYRELYALSHALVGHWSRVAARVPDESTRAALEQGVAAARRLRGELADITAEHDLHGGPAALGLGARIADLRNLAVDRFLERNQAMRLAVMEARQLELLLSYLGRVADAREASERADFCRRWGLELSALGQSVEDEAVALGDDPDAAIEPLEGSAAGRAAHGVAFAIGTAGEWVDRRAARHRGT